MGYNATGATAKPIGSPWPNGEGLGYLACYDEPMGCFRPWPGATGCFLKAAA